MFHQRKRWRGEKRSIKFKILNGRNRSQCQWSKINTGARCYFWQLWRGVILRAINEKCHSVVVSCSIPGKGHIFWRSWWAQPPVAMARVDFWHNGLPGSRFSVAPGSFWDARAIFHKYAPGTTHRFVYGWRSFGA